MDGISFQYDGSLKDADLTYFKNSFKDVLNFITKQVSSIIGTKKSFNRDIIKKILLEEGSEESFTAKITLEKSRVSNLKLKFFMNTPNGVSCIIWKKEYESNENLNSDINYISENIDKINKTQEEN